MKAPALLTVTIFLGIAPALPAESPPAADVEFFEKQVRPLLVEHCFKCHGNGKAKGGLSLASRASILKGGDSGPALVPGDVAKSLLIQAVRYDGETRMPPKQKLPDRAIADLTSWVQRGAPWPAAPAEGDALRPHGAAISAAERAFWAFQPIADPPLPALSSQAEWVRKPLDRFVLAKLQAHELRPVRPADKHALLRRVTFDLVGLPPTAEEIAAFLNDDSPQAYEKVVDRLLASPHYGERWARHWLDVARYGEDQAHSFQPRLFPNGYRYRDWVVGAFNADMPYDRFIVEQIAGDLLKDGDATAHRSALGFFALGPHYYQDGAARKLVEATELDDRIDTLTRGFLALTVSCARCHDHKFDPIAQGDYYSLAGVFQSTKYEEIPLGPPDVIERYNRSQKEIRTCEAKIKQFLKTEGKAQGDKKPSEATKQKLAEMRRELNQLKKNAPQPPLVHTLSEGQPVNMRIYLRGNPDKEGEVAPRRFLRILAGDNPPPFAQGSGRLELARAIADPKNPLTARVLVNRVWQHHFGRGIVGTPSNFGKLGERPTHPELLDHLASRFIASSWSIKALHREILLSATYRQSCDYDEHNAAVDPDNRLLWRMNRRRLDVEAWRDALLTASGELDNSLGGPPADIGTPANKRRTLYGKISRHNLDSLLRLFDFPDPNITSGARPVTIVPLQQLFVLNSEFMIARAHSLAAKLAAEEKDDVARIRKAFVRVFGRPAGEREIRMGLAFLRTSEKTALSPWEQYAQVLLSANEFTFVD